MATKHQRIGLHVSAAGGAQNAPENAKEMGVEVFQFFSRSPRGGGAPVISDEQAAEFKRLSKEYGFESYIHTPYYVNFASKNKRVYHGSIAVVREELERGSKLGVKYVVTHLGSARDWVPKLKVKSEKLEVDDGTPKEALEQTVRGLKEVYTGNPKFSSQLLLEIAAGSGSIVGDTFEELGWILNELGRKDVHVCLDTCHMFAAGYDIRNATVLEETMKAFRKSVGVSHLKLVHMNDSKADLGGRTDRHEHMGNGKIGSEGLKAILHHKDFQNVNFILETKHDELIHDDLKFLKRNRVQK